MTACRKAALQLSVFGGPEGGRCRAEGLGELRWCALSSRGERWGAAGRCLPTSAEKKML